MKNLLTNQEIQNELNHCGAAQLSPTLVAMWNNTDEMYGIYQKHPANPAWELQMTCPTLESFQEE